jgi:hypothetical protein
VWVPKRFRSISTVSVRGTNLTLLAQVQIPIGPGRFVGGAEEFNDGDDAVAAGAVDDFEESFRERLGLGLDKKGLRHGHRGFVAGDQARFGCISHQAHSRKPQEFSETMKGRPNQPFLDACPEFGRKDSLDRVARVNDQAGMNVAPVGLEKRVHPGKGTRHAWASAGEGTSKPTRRTQLHHKPGIDKWPLVKKKAAAVAVVTVLRPDPPARSPDRLGAPRPPAAPWGRWSAVPAADTAALPGSTAEARTHLHTARSGPPAFSLA